MEVSWADENRCEGDATIDDEEQEMMEADAASREVINRREEKESGQRGS